jgi:hypothetical protein
VELVSFTATQQGTAVRLAWETTSELDNVGFNLYRAESSDGQWLQLNQALILSQAPGSPEGASYQFVDASVRPGVVYYYWLEDVERNGLITRHGPVTARVLLEAKALPGRGRPTARPALPIR